MILKLADTVGKKSNEKVKEGFTGAIQVYQPVYEKGSPDWTELWEGKKGLWYLAMRGGHEKRLHLPTVLKMKKRMRQMTQHPFLC